MNAAQLIDAFVERVVSAATRTEEAGSEHRASGAQLFWLSIGALAPATVLAAGPALVIFTAGSGTWLSYVGAAVIALAVAACRSRRP